MSFKAFIRILKNLNPFKNFAKPIPGRSRFGDESPSLSGISISYNALTESIAEASESTTYSQDVAGLESSHSFAHLTNSYQLEAGSSDPVLVAPKIMVSPEDSIVLPQPVMSDVIILPAASSHVSESAEHAVIIEAEVVDISKESPEKAKKSRSRAVLAKAKPSRSKKAVESKKKTAKKSSTRTSSIRKKKEKPEVPPEAMGFGF